MELLRRIILFVFILPVLLHFSVAQTIQTTNENRQEWIKKIIAEKADPNYINNYIFYYTGHHGIIWSIIIPDTSGYIIYNGTTRQHILENNACLDLDSKFIKNNIQTIKWGFDSLAIESKGFEPYERNKYSPIFDDLYIVKNNHIVFSLYPIEYYTGRDSTRFNANLYKLTYLMMWLASPSIRQYLPEPNDSSFVPTRLAVKDL